MVEPWSHGEKLQSLINTERNATFFSLFLTGKKRISSGESIFWIMTLFGSFSFSFLFMTFGSFKF